MADYVSSSESLRIEVECTGPLASDTTVYVVDPITGYKSKLEGVHSVTFYAIAGSINTVNLEVTARRVNIQGVLDKVENQTSTD